MNFMLIIAIIFLVMGLLMVIIPKQATKKENREDEASVKKTRIYGIVLIIIAIVFFAINFLM